MPLLEWLQSNPSVHVVSECFAVHNDLSGAEEALNTRAHLLPMSDASLFHFSLGLALAGTPTFLQWPTSDLASLSGFVDKVSSELSASLIVRVPISNTVNLEALAGSSAYSVVHDDHRSAVLETALNRPGIHIILESLSAMALHRLESRFIGLQTDSSTLQSSEHPQCTVVGLNQHASMIEEALSGATHCDIISLHKASGLDATTLESIQRTGRVVCVGLPTAWMSDVIQGSFWSLEAEPEFADATIQSIQQSLHRVFEA